MTRVNLCVNPHGDVDATGWQCSGDVLTQTAVTGFPKGFALASGGSANLVFSAPGAVTPGQVYVASALIKSISAIGDAQMYLEWRDSGGTAFDYTAGPTVTCPTNIVTAVEATGTAPVGAAFVSLMTAGMFGARQTGAVLIEPGSTPSTYADGDSLDWIWTGTAGLSASSESGVVTNFLDGISTSASGGTGSLSVSRPLVGKATGASDVFGSFDRARSISGTSAAATAIDQTTVQFTRGLLGKAIAASRATGDLTVDSPDVVVTYGGFLTNLLDRGKEPVTVFPEEVTFDTDGNTWTRAATVGIDTVAVVQVAAASGTAGRRAEQDNEGFEVEENWRIRFPREFPHVLGAQAKVVWRGLTYSVVGDARRYNGSRRTAHVEYTIRRS